MTDPTLSVFLAPGASGTAAGLARHVDGLRQRGIAARAIDIPKRRAEDAVPAYAALLGEGTDVVIGGHSYGGRVASLLAAERRVRGLVLLSYPLHRPGTTDWEGRSAHFRTIGCPVLMLSGENDQFARIDLLRAAARLLPTAELVTYPGVRHGLAPVLEDALDRVAGFVKRISPVDQRSG